MFFSTKKKIERVGKSGKKSWKTKAFERAWTKGVDRWIANSDADTSQILDPWVWHTFSWTFFSLSCYFLFLWTDAVKSKRCRFSWSKSQTTPLYHLSRRCFWDVRDLLYESESPPPLIFRVLIIFSKNFWFLAAAPSATQPIHSAWRSPPKLRVAEVFLPLVKE